MRYELIIFDWDGTLMDSAPRIVASMQAAAIEAQWGELGAEAVRNIIGLGLPEAIAMLCPGIGSEQAARLKERYVHHFVHADPTPMRFFPGVVEGLRGLHASGRCQLAVATGKSRRGLDRAFVETASGDWFTASRTADLTRSKPHPQMLEELLAELDVPVERAVMVGDTEYDLEMARSIGMDCVGVSHGVHAVERLALSQPKLIAHSMAELCAWLCERT
ncbi:HAD family hydrolase [Halomonas dongshanensis]|uniref:HAD-IA family hydrolase n=1 Tax=Halomonas dongshanensis TaxID=2890835 RepID=A0ABT2EEQ0_9GAMM|nr:HAD-IA family hydrolase [Halomonas dongshanensis]